MKLLAPMGLMALVALAFATPAARAEVKTQEVDYKDGDVTLKGYLAYPEDAQTSPKPGILVAPEWWGLTEYPKMRARQLAELGYVALAIDVYGDGKSTDDFKEAASLSGPFNKDRQAMRTRVMAGLKQLADSKLVDKTKLGAIGYCFGGTCALELARSSDALAGAGMPLVGVCTFHAGLSNPDPSSTSKPIKPRVLVQTGADDPMVTAEQRAAFEQEMKDAQADYEVIVYGGAVHAFTNPNADRHGNPAIKYNKAADERSFQAMKEFFAAVFK